MLSQPNNITQIERPEMDSLRLKMLRDLEQFLSESIARPMPRFIPRLVRARGYNPPAEKISRVQPC